MAKVWKVPQADCALIKKISRNNIETTLSKLDPFIVQSRWLAKSNRYSINTVGRIAFDTKNGRVISAKPMAQYISASAVLHCADGWSYLGRAINCLLKGDPHRVVHLAYYAELRAALSLLACEGIGVFSKSHFVIDGPESARKLPAQQQTHVAAWSYLRYWSTLRRSGDTFSNVIAPGGIPLSDWFQPIGGVDAVVRPKARQWFSQWSMDLALFSDDRDARNESSYRPDGIPMPWYVSPVDALLLATGLWEACEPSTASLFDGIDRHILRMTVESSFSATNGVTAAQDPTRFAALVDSIVDPLALDAATSANWKHFLNRGVVPDDPPLFFHSSQNPLDRTVGHAAILARAMLLLRLATGSTLRLIRSAGISAEKLGFWWSQLGINRGLWDGAKDHSELLDLWDDITALFEDIRIFRDTTPVADQTFQMISARLPQVVAGLGGCERVAIWSLTP
jgi:hypothetical protein